MMEKIMGKWALGIFIAAFASQIEAGSRAMKALKKIFAMFIIVAVAIVMVIATTSPAEALLVCKAPGHCKNVYGSVNSGRNRSSRGRSYHYGNSYDSDGSSGSMMALGSNGGDTAVNHRSNGSLVEVSIWPPKLCLLCSESTTEAAANDGDNDVPQGQVISGGGQVYSRPSPTVSQASYAPRDGSVTTSCDALERSCQGLEGCGALVEECWAERGQ
ncbi:MAG: hypothetical protein AAB343_00575 [Patescibacteria group bacterium]